MKLPGLIKTAVIHPLSQGAGTSEIQDPLRDHKLGPKGVPQWRRGLSQLGQGFGLGEGYLAAIAGPAISMWGGHEIGHMLGENSAANEGLSGQEAADRVSHHENVGTATGATIGGIAGLRSIGMRTLFPQVEASGYGATGGWMGKKIENAYPKDRRLVERIHQLSPAEGLALIRQAEHGGRASPHELQAMKDAYETRRQYLGDVAKHAAMGIPAPKGLTDPLEDKDLAPRGVTPWHRTGESIGKGVGTTLGGIAGIVAPPLIGAMIGRHVADDAGLGAGAGVGAVGDLVGLPAGMAAGYLAGGAAGSGLGHLAAKFQPDTQHAVEKIKRMNPAEGHTYIRTLERLGRTPPHVIAAMREAHEYRRRGLGYQLATSTSPSYP